MSEKRTIVSYELLYLVSISTKLQLLKTVNRRFFWNVMIMVLIGVVAYIASQYIIDYVQSGHANRTVANILSLALICSSLAAVGVIIYRSKMIETKLANTSIDRNKKSKELRKKNAILEELNTVIANIDQAVTIIDQDDKISWVNSSFERLFGFLKEEALGERPSKLLAGIDTDLNEIKKLDDAIFERKEAVTLKIMLYRKDSRSFWARVDVTPILDEKGELSKYIAIISDISTEHEIELKLLKSQSDFTDITGTVEDVLYLYNIEEKRYEFISLHSEKVMGAPPEFFYSGQNHTQNFAHPDDRKLLLDAHEQIDSGIAYDITYRLIIDGELRWIRERSFPIRDEEQKVVRNSGVCSDETEFMNNSIQLEKARSASKLVAEIGAQMNEELGVVPVIERIHSSISKLMNSDTFGIGIIDEEKRCMNFPLFIEGDTTLRDLSYSLEDATLFNLCALQDREIMIRDFEKEIHTYSDQKLEYISGKSPESIIYLPLKSERRIIGVITVQSLEKNAFDEDQLQMLKSISAYAANSVTKGAIYDSLEIAVRNRTVELADKNETLIRRNKEIEMTGRLGVQITEKLNLGDAFEEIYSDVCDLFNAEMFGIRIYHPERNEVEYTYGMENNVRDKVFSIPMSDKNNYSVWCIDNRKELFINDNEVEYKKYVKESIVVTGKMPSSLIMHPIIIKDEIIGVITVQSYRKNAFDDHLVYLLRALASYVSSALSNIIIFESLEHKVNERTLELSHKNRDILASINYAKRIQLSTLTNETDMKNVFSRSFALYKPKDIVSGDFYRFDNIYLSNGGVLRGFMVGDCTGHGVPGATLAILCSSLINHSLTLDYVKSVSDGLGYVRNHLTQLFSSSGDDVGIDEGMDAGFGAIDEVNNILYFSGAFIDCYIVRSGGVITIKGDRQHVGLTANPLPFVLHEYQLQKGDALYITSDGYLDQFGQTTRRKFMKKRFLETIIEASSLPMENRKGHLDSVFEEWRGTEEQVDDICVIGVELT